MRACDESAHATSYTIIRAATLVESSHEDQEHHQVLQQRTMVLLEAAKPAPDNSLLLAPPALQTPVVYPRSLCVHAQYARWCSQRVRTARWSTRTSASVVLSY